jgi:hypothetical protein
MNRATAQDGFGMLPDSLMAGANWTSVSTDDRAARYLAWMALGGTDVSIPQPVLQLVANTAVLGIHPTITSDEISANMLAVARATCNAVLLKGPVGGFNLGTVTLNIPFLSLPLDSPFVNGIPELIGANGAAELWLKLCSLGNPPPVRAISGDGTFSVTADLYPQSEYGPYPAGSQRGVDPTQANGITPDNSVPWCVRRSHDPLKVGPPMPISADPRYPRCPDTIDDPSKDLSQGLEKLDCTLYSNRTCLTPDEIDRWALRGAINAGFAVFLYLDAVGKQKVTPLPDYDQCPPAPSP